MGGLNLSAERCRVCPEMEIVQVFHLVQLHENPGLEGRAPVFGEDDVVRDVGTGVVSISRLGVCEEQDVSEFIGWRYLGEVLQGVGGGLGRVAEALYGLGIEKIERGPVAVWQVPRAGMRGTGERVQNLAHPGWQEVHQINFLHGIVPFDGT